MADFQNLRRKIHEDIESEVSRRFDRFMLDLLEIFDDFGEGPGHIQGEPSGYLGA